MANTNNSQFTVLELGVCSGNNLNGLTRQISELTENYKYFTTEHTTSFEESKKVIDSRISPEIQKHLSGIPETFENIAENGLSTFNGNFDGKADLIVASHCLSFCSRDKFFELMQNLTGAIKDCGIFMGDIYLDKMSAQTFPYPKEEIIALLQGKIDANGNPITIDKNGNPSSKAVFDGFNVKAQMSGGDLMIHFIAEKSNEQGTTFSEETLLDKSNPKVEASNLLYATINKSAEARENRGDWVNYVDIYSQFPTEIPQDKLTPEIENAIVSFNGVMPPRPLVESFFDSENGQKWLSDRIQRQDTDSNGEQTNLTVSSNVQEILNGIMQTNTSSQAQSSEDEVNPDLELFKKLEEGGDPFKDMKETSQDFSINDNGNND